MDEKDKNEITKLIKDVSRQIMGFLCLLIYFVLRGISFLMEKGSDGYQYVTTTAWMLYGFWVFLIILVPLMIEPLIEKIEEHSKLKREKEVEDFQLLSEKVEFYGKSSLAAILFDPRKEKYFKKRSIVLYDHEGVKTLEKGSNYKKILEPYFGRGAVVKAIQKKSIEIKLI